MLELYDVARWLADPMFWWFAVGANVFSMGVFLLFAVPMTWAAWADPPALRRWRIQAPRKMRKPVVGPAVRSWLLNNGVLFVGVLAAWPVLRLSGIHLGPWPAWYVVVGQLVLFIYLDDFLYYWMHRAFHQGWAWKRIHTHHHRIGRPWAITGHQMHPVEFLATASLMLLGPVLLGAHIGVLYVWIALRQWEAAEGHCGYDVPFSPSHLLPGSDGALHHDVHHSGVRGNYAGFLAWTDRVFGTLVPGYEAIRAERRGE